MAMQDFLEECPTFVLQRTHHLQHSALFETFQKISRTQEGRKPGIPMDDLRERPRREKRARIHLERDALDQM